MAGTAAEVWRLGLRLLDEPFDQVLRLLVPARDPVLGQRLLCLRRGEPSLERTQVPANLDADSRVLNARLEVHARVLVEFTQRVSDGVRLLNDRTNRVRVVVGPGCEQLRQHLVAVGRRLRHGAEPRVGSGQLREPIAFFNAEMYEPGMKPLDHRALGLATASERSRKAILALQGTVSGRARLFEELVAEIAKPVPIRRADQLAALQTHSGRLRHPDADVDGLPVNLLQSPVVSLAKKAEEEVDDERLEAVGLSQVVRDRRPRTESWSVRCRTSLMYRESSRSEAFV